MDPGFPRRLCQPQRIGHFSVKFFQKCMRNTENWPKRGSCSCGLRPLPPKTNPRPSNPPMLQVTDVLFLIPVPTRQVGENGVRVQNRQDDAAADHRYSALRYRRPQPGVRHRYRTRLLLIGTNTKQKL